MYQQSTAIATGRIDWNVQNLMYSNLYRNDINIVPTKDKSISL